jgi:hypothetical protein
VLIELARTGKTREERKWWAASASHCDYGFIVKKGKPSDSTPLFVYYKIFFFFWKIIFLKVNL